MEIKTGRFNFSTEVLLLVLVTLVAPGLALAQAPFYKGKTITILAGTGAGNVYDLYARLFARHKVKIIRDSFAKTIQDEAVRADGKQTQLEFDPGTAEELDRLAKEVVNQPSDTVAQMKKLLGK